MDYGPSASKNIGGVEQTPDTQMETKCVLPVQVLPPSNHIIVANDSQMNGALISQNLQPADVPNLNQFHQHQMTSLDHASAPSEKSTHLTAFYESEAQNVLNNLHSNNKNTKTKRHHPYSPSYKSAVSNDLASQNNQMDQKLAYRCKDCNHVSKSSKMLKKHIYHSHIQATLFNCAMCEYAATQNCDLSYHYVSVHKLDIDTVASLIRSSTREREKHSFPGTQPTIAVSISQDSRKPSISQPNSSVQERGSSELTEYVPSIASAMPLTKNPVFDVVNTYGSLSANQEPGASSS